MAAMLALTAGALMVHGYHPYAEDSEIYLPGVLKILDPSLFPLNHDFFLQHAAHSFYPNLIARSTGISHLPLPWAAFLWHLLSIFLMLFGTWRLAAKFFAEERARWMATSLMAGLLTLPVAGTALYILDQYLNPRNLAAFAAVFALAEVLGRRYVRSGLWLVFAAAVHPLMASFAILFCIWVVVLRRLKPRPFGLAAWLPFGVTWEPPPVAYHEVALRQRYFYLLRWEWYEWLGLIGPLILFWWFGRIARRRRLENLELVSRAMVPFVGIAGVAALLLSIPARLEALARLEPLRCLALAYMVLIVIGGGLASEYIFHARIGRWLALFVPLSLGMYFVQRQLFPASAHIEWPWAKPRNLWAQAFDWVRENTPKDALFALNPEHMSLPGEDEIGFRALARRSMLADAVKDKGAASMFPPLSVPWLEQFSDQKNWKEFGAEDFQALRRKYGISWIVIEQPRGDGLDCPYRNAAVRICRIE